VTSIDCDEFHERASELALGLLAGDERGAALDHVERCAGCRAHLDGLVQVADNLLLLAPAVEPGIGFESRVTARLSSAVAAGPRASPIPVEAIHAPRARRRGIRPLLVGAAAAVVVAAALVGLAAGRHQTTAIKAAKVDAQTARAVVVRADGGRSTCQLVAFPGTASQPARLVIHLDEPADRAVALGNYQVLVEPSNGSAPVALATIPVEYGQGTLAAAIPPGIGAVHGVEILEATTIKYRATFPST
jgi:anti-sigma-K factor RskA